MKALVALLAARALAVAPSGLLCNFQSSPALGVGPKPRFSWIQAPCGSAEAGTQLAYRLELFFADDASLFWDSGKVAGNDSSYVPYAGPELEPGRKYAWRVRTWSEGCASEASEPATLVTSLFEGFDEGARLVSAKSKGTFAYLRKELEVPEEVTSALAFVTAPTEEPLLANFKFYLDGSLVDLGPGRGEAPVWGGDGAYRAMPYASLDVTSLLGKGRHALALQAMHSKGGSALLQLVMRFKGGKTTVVVSDESWSAFDGDAHRKPGPPKHGHSAGNAFMEYIDARNEPVGWQDVGFVEKAGWGAAVATAVTQKEALHAKMEPPLEVYEVNATSLVPVSQTAFVADFGKEFQGGLRLFVANGTENQTVRLACGEAQRSGQVMYDWGWDFTWTLRSGAQTLEQHKYMECRWASLSFSGSVPEFRLSAWKVHYPWREEESSFSCSDEVLQAVWELSRYTLKAGSLGDFSDSNTRERRPYEADGIIAATSRLLLQRDVLWSRHSSAWVLQNPTWPVEWKQLSPFLGWQDYMWTGQPDLAAAFADVMHERSMIPFREGETGLLDTTKMGKHIVDWMPNGAESDQTVARHEFTASKHMSVTHAYCVRGLEMLSEMMAVAGRAQEAERFAKEAKDLKALMMEKMWNDSAFCDGVCAEVGGKSLLMSNMFSLALGLLPQNATEKAWAAVTRWGLESIGAYGAFWYQAALAGSPYGKAFTPPDDGSQLLLALTKCDRTSWCSGLREDGLTMTRESWHDGTYSHPWGASPVAGIVWGVMGIRQTAPAFKSFTVMPKLGRLAHASLLLPTLMGFVNASATPQTLEVQVPCGCRARLCLPRSAKPQLPRGARLLLDGREEASEWRKGHLCLARELGCGVSGAARRLSAEGGALFA